LKIKARLQALLNLFLEDFGFYEKGAAWAENERGAVDAVVMAH